MRVSRILGLDREVRNATFRLARDLIRETGLPVVRLPVGPILHDRGLLRELEQEARKRRGVIAMSRDSGDIQVWFIDARRVQWWEQ